MGYTTPTPIQEQAIPMVLAGRDVMGLAQTGTGKTAAFTLPILERLLAGKRRQLRALVVAPTRELAEQINDHITSLGKETGLTSIAVYGGVNIKTQIKALRRGVDILVACPGRLLDLLNQQVMTLNSVQVLVLDEADHMFDMGFLPDIRRIIQQVPENRQTLLFSATMPPDIRQLADKILKDPCYVKIAIDTPLDTISHIAYPVAQHQKTDLLLEILKNTAAQAILIFTRTKHRAKRLGEQLSDSGYSAISLQGNLSQNKRQEALDGFRDGEYQIMVATDIAARGIDVSRISHVINYDMTDTPDAYTHRIGRTGRATRKGEAYTFMTSEDRRLMESLERRIGISFEYRKQPGFFYEGASAQDRETPTQRNYAVKRPFHSGRQRSYAR